MRACAAGMCLLFTVETVRPGGAELAQAHAGRLSAAKIRKPGGTELAPIHKAKPIFYKSTHFLLNGKKLHTLPGKIAATRQAAGSRQGLFSALQVWRA